LIVSSNIILKLLLNVSKRKNIITNNHLFISIEYNEIKDKPGDSFFIRALFDRTIELSDAGSNSSQLQFHKDDVLYVDNTMYNGVPGNWRAWLVDHNGYKQQVGIIPSKYK